jgi:hypothetical protein
MNIPTSPPEWGWGLRCRPLTFRKITPKEFWKLFTPPKIPAQRNEKDRIKFTIVDLIPNFVQDTAL